MEITLRWRHKYGNTLRWRHEMLITLRWRHENANFAQVEILKCRLRYLMQYVVFNENAILLFSS
jgi:hypothetical protein